MKAIVASPQGAQLAERPDPAPAPACCVVRVKVALVLPADITAARRSDAAQVTLGQAFVGTVDVIHPDAPPDRARDGRQWIGKRVAAHPVVRCGRCERCLSGLGAHCLERTILGTSRDGGLAERVAVPLMNLVALPESLDDERALFAVPVANALEATRHVRIEGKTYITVLGDDLSALVTTQVMTRLNAAVRIVARSSATIAAAEKLGVKHRLASEVGRRGDQHVVIDSTGSAESLDLAMRLVRPRGTILLMAAAGASELAALVAGELRIQGCGHGALPEAVDLLARRGIEVVGLIERRLSLTSAVEAFADGRSGTLVRM